MSLQCTVEHTDCTSELLSNPSQPRTLKYLLDDSPEHTESGHVVFMGVQMQCACIRADVHIFVRANVYIFFSVQRNMCMHVCYTHANLYAVHVNRLSTVYVCKMCVCIWFLHACAMSDHTHWHPVLPGRWLRHRADSRLWHG